MNDQVDKLKALGIKALCVHSAKSSFEIDIALDNAAYGSYKFLYLSPERLGTELFRVRVRKMEPSILVVDEDIAYPNGVTIFVLPTCVLPNS